jgi:hypothetical protein
MSSELHDYHISPYWREDVQVDIFSFGAVLEALENKLEIMLLVRSFGQSGIYVYGNKECVGHMDLITWHWIMGHSVCLSWNSVFGVHLTTAVLYFFLASIHLFKLLTISYSVMIQEHCCWYIHCMFLTCTLFYPSILSVSWPCICCVQVTGIVGQMLGSNGPPLG